MQLFSQPTVEFAMEREPGTIVSTIVAKGPPSAVSHEQSCTVGQRYEVIMREFVYPQYNLPFNLTPTIELKGRLTPLLACYPANAS